MTDLDICFESIENSNMLGCCCDLPVGAEDTSIIECNLLHHLRCYLPYLIQQGCIVWRQGVLTRRDLGNFSLSLIVSFRYLHLGAFIRRQRHVLILMSNLFFHFICFSCSTSSILWNCNRRTGINKRVLSSPILT